MGMDMDLNSVAQDLNRRFAEPLPEFYQRRIIFWYDEDRQFQDDVAKLQLDCAQVLVLSDANNFAIKKLLSADNQTDNFCVYVPGALSDKENWLLPIQLYSEEYRADLISRWISEMRLGDSAGMSKAVRDYRSFFKKKAHRTKISNLPMRAETAEQLQGAMMAVLCGVKDTDPNLLIRTILRAGLDKDTNELYQSLARHQLDSVFWAMVRRVAGYAEEDCQLTRLACHLLLTASAGTIDIERLAGLEDLISTSHQTQCYDCVSEWARDEKARDNLYAVAEYVERELRLPNRFGQVETRDLTELDIFPCVNELILSRLTADIGDNNVDVALIRDMIEKRRNKLWYDRTRNFYASVAQIANMQEFYLNHAAGFHTAEAQGVWKEYVTDYYQMDTYYRRFHRAFADSLMNTRHPLLEDPFQRAADWAERLYVNWYLEELGANWTAACQDHLAQYGRVLEVPRQDDFYNDFVRGADGRIFVIISDALRYEVAVSLADALRLDMPAKIHLTSIQALFPSVTKFGMAALLPHGTLTAEIRGKGEVGVLADGVPTDAPNRDKILKKRNPASVALKYNDLIKMKRAERSNLVKNMSVVYIYHDQIDNIGHAQEEATFSSCDRAIDEVKNMVRIIVNDFSGSKILITADHGFLYTYKPLAEYGKVDRSVASDEEIESDRRYLIAKKGATPEYLLPVKFMDAASYVAFAPRPQHCLKKRGGGTNYVHGGISLQELVVPVIEYRHMRNDNAEYKKNRSKYDAKPVGLRLLTATHKISNMIFPLCFYQSEAVGGIYEEARYELYFENSEGQRVSDIQSIVADKTATEAQDRTFRVHFNLKSMKFSDKESYYLVMADTSGLQMPKREEFTIDIAFALHDFDFLSP